MKISVEDFKANWESLNRQNQKMTLKAVPTSGRFKMTSSVVITMSLGFNSTCRRKKPDEEEHKESLKHARRKLERLMYAAMPCEEEVDSGTRKLGAELNASHKVPMTIYGCIVESTRQ